MPELPTSRPAAPPRRAILVRGARQLLTLRGPAGPRRGDWLRDLGMIFDGAVLIVEGVIEDVGPSRRVENLAAAREAVEITANGRVVMPGFVDARSHLISGPALLDDYELRIAGAGEGEILESGGGPPRTARALRASSRPRLELLAKKLMREFVRHGTTTLEARSGLGGDERTELKILRALRNLRGRTPEIVVTCFGASWPPAGQADPAAYLDGMGARMLPKVRRGGLADFAAVRCGAGGFPEDAARRYLAAAKAAGLGLKVICGESGREGGVALAVEAGAAAAEQLECIGAEECRLLADSGTVATLVPGETFFRGGTRYPPARRLIDSGAAVAVATGYSAGLSPTCSMPAVLSLACNLMRMSPAEAVSAGTINGAHALGLADRLGSLERGKRADLIMLNVADYREIPYHFGMNLVAMTMKKGDVIYPRMEFV